MNEELDIDQLFSNKFEKFEIQSPEEEWLKLSSKLSRFNFVRFSFVTFNVYYLIALVAFAGTATLTSVTSHKLSKKVSQLEQMVEKYQKKDSIESSPVLPPDSAVINQNHKNVETPTKKNMTAKGNINSPKENKNEKSAMPSNTTPVVKDTVQSLNKRSIQPDTTQSPKVKKVKKTVTIKKDNVIVKDTVVINKQNK